VHGAVPGDQFAWALGALCALHRIPFDADLVLKQFPPPYSIEKLIEALRALGFRTGLAAAGTLATTATFPCIGLRRTGNSDTLGAAVVAGREGEALLVFDATSPDPQKVDLAEALTTFEPQLLLAARELPDAADPDAARAAPRRFGFRWFVPELLRHKRIWRDVLAASLALQVAGLATPLFTQVVIDKVIAHHSQMTLWAVGVGLGMFILFGAAMTWMRQ
jgi:subfamily B ATP-binding cassette protein HlyB/CyaB